MFPETAGKTLEEVEAMFLDPKGRKYLGTPPWRTRVVKRALDVEPVREKHVDSPIMHEEDHRAPSEDEEAAVGEPAHSESVKI